MFGAFVLAVMCMCAFGATALARSARLAYERLHDALTGLPNRTLFIQRVDQALANRHKTDGGVAVMFMDLDGFKPINDAHGHASGDALLSSVARRLVNSARRGDVVSRFGGDEFLILCIGLTEDHQAVDVAERMRQRIAEPHEVAGLTVTVGCSIGVAVPDGYTENAISLIHKADLAMYTAKESGRIQVFRPLAPPVTTDSPA